eukprot:6197046-Pleurochrysis_carterae.AAC.1
MIFTCRGSGYLPAYPMLSAPRSSMARVHCFCRNFPEHLLPLLYGEFRRAKGEAYDELKAVESTTDHDKLDETRRSGVEKILLWAHANGIPSFEPGQKSGSRGGFSRDAQKKPVYEKFVYASGPISNGVVRIEHKSELGMWTITFYPHVEGSRNEPVLLATGLSGRILLLPSPSEHLSEVFRSTNANDALNSYDQSLVVHEWSTIAEAVIKLDVILQRLLSASDHATASLDKSILTQAANAVCSVKK